MSYANIAPCFILFPMNIATFASLVWDRDLAGCKLYLRIMWPALIITSVLLSKNTSDNIQPIIADMKEIRDEVIMAFSEVNQCLDDDLNKINLGAMNESLDKVNMALVDGQSSVQKGMIGPLVLLSLWTLLVLFECFSGRCKDYLICLPGSSDDNDKEIEEAP